MFYLFLSSVLARDLTHDKDKNNLSYRAYLPGSMYEREYVVFTGFSGSSQVQFRFCQFSEMHLKFSGGKGFTGNTKKREDIFKIFCQQSWSRLYSLRVDVEHMPIF